MNTALFVMNDVNGDIDVKESPTREMVAAARGERLSDVVLLFPNETVAFDFACLVMRFIRAEVQLTVLIYQIRSVLHVFSPVSRDAWVRHILRRTKGPGTEMFVLDTMAPAALVSDIMYERWLALVEAEKGTAVQV